MSATHCSEVSADDGFGESRESESAGPQAGGAQVTRHPSLSPPRPPPTHPGRCVGFPQLPGDRLSGTAAAQPHAAGGTAAAYSWGRGWLEAGPRWSPWALQRHLGKDAAGLGGNWGGGVGPRGLCGLQGEVAVGVSPLANGTSPSSTTSVGMAPLPCSMDTTLSWEQFLPSGDGPGRPEGMSPVHSHPPDLPVLLAEATGHMHSWARALPLLLFNFCRRSSGPSARWTLPGTEGVAPMSPLSQAFPEGDDTDGLCPWGVFWLDGLMS